MGWGFSQRNQSQCELSLTIIGFLCGCGLLAQHSRYGVWWLIGWCGCMLANTGNPFHGLLCNFCQVWDFSLSNQSMPASEIHEYGVDGSLGALEFCYSCCFRVTRGLKSGQSYLLGSCFQSPLLYLISLGLSFLICKTWELNYWSLNPSSSKISKYFPYNLHPFPSFLSHNPFPSTVILWISVNSLSRDLQDVFPTELQHCMCQHVDMCCGSSVVLGPLYMLLLLWEEASDSSILLFYLGLQPLPHWVTPAFDWARERLHGKSALGGWALCGSLGDLVWSIAFSSQFAHVWFVAGKDLRRGTWERYFSALHLLYSLGALAGFHMGSFIYHFIMVPS